MHGRAGALHTRHFTDETALTAAIFATSTALLTALTLALLLPAAIPFLLLSLTAAALLLTQRLARTTATDPRFLGAATAAPLLTLTILLLPGLGFPATLGLPLAAALALTTAVLATRTRPPFDTPPTCPRCGYITEGLDHCPECAFPSPQAPRRG
jgi:hypothetical protein